MQDEDEARRRRRRAFRRRAHAAVAGLHLPSISELLQGMSFMADDLSRDSQAFAERLLPRLDLRAPNGLTLHHLLTALTLQPQREDFLAAAEAFQKAEDSLGKRIKFPQECALRCRYYAAATGCPDSARDVGLEALLLAQTRRTPPDEAHNYCVTAIGWLLVSAWKREAWRTTLEDASDVARQKGSALVKELIDEHQRQEAEQKGQTKLHSDKDSKSEEDDPLADVFAADDAESGVIVVAQLGDTDLSGARHVQTEFGGILKQRLPLAPLPDLAELRQQLLAGFPHAIGVIDTLLDALVGQPHVRLRPTVLVGNPGSGKTTFGSRLFSLLGLRFETFPCGGVSDASVGGTARRWSSGEPSLPLSLIRRYAVASPGIILDELEKSGTSRHNGALVDVLLGLFEPQTAKTWFDPYIQAPLDLSHVVWLGTANSLEGIPGALRDRCRILRFPDPGIEHLPVLAAHLLRALVLERQLDARWALPLSVFELDHLATAWRGGSIRALSRLVEGVLKVRNDAGIRH